MYSNNIVMLCKLIGKLFFESFGYSFENLEAQEFSIVSDIYGITIVKVLKASTKVNLTMNVKMN